MTSSARLTPLFFLLGAALGLPAQAQDVKGYWQYEAWAAATAPVTIGEATRRCVVMPSAPIQPAIRVEILNSAPPPPESFPSIAIMETAPRNATTQMQSGMRITLHVGAAQTPGHIAQAGIDEAGIHQAGALIPRTESQDVLRAMAQGGSIEIRADGKSLVQKSLAGFSKAYRKAMAECSFGTEGILE